MWSIMITSECATATAARLAPRRAARRRYCAALEVAGFIRRAACAASTKAARTHGLPVRVRPLCRLPALSGLPGPRPTQEARWPALGKRLISLPISAKMTAAVRWPTPGSVCNSRRSSAWGSRRVGVPPRGDLFAHLLQDPIQRVARRHLLAEQEAVVGAELPGQGALHLRDLLAQDAPRPLRHACRLGRARPQRPPHLVARFAGAIGDHRRQLTGGPFPGLLQPVPLGDPLVAQRGARARQLAQVAWRPGRDEAGPQQALTQEVGDPLALGPIGRASRDRLALLRIDDQHREGVGEP